MLRSNNQIDLVVFGFEGTLVDAADLAVECHQKTLEQFARGSCSPEYVLSCLVKYGVSDALDAMTCGTRQDELEDMHAFYDALVEERRQKQAVGAMVTPKRQWTQVKGKRVPDTNASTDPIPYEPIRYYNNAREVIERLAHVPMKLAIMAPISRRQLDNDFDLAGKEIKSFFDISITADEATDAMDTPAGRAATLARVLSFFNEDRSRVAIVSSDPMDLAAANIVNIDYKFGLSHGYAQPADLIEAGGVVCDNLEEVHDHLLKESKEE